MVEYSCMTWNYIAGFFDGEGSITNNGKGFRITICQTNKEILEDIKCFVGFGYVIKVKKRKKHWKDSWVYYIAKQREVYSFLTQISPFLKIKRESAESCLPLLKQTIERQQKQQIRLSKRIRAIKKLRNKGLTYRAIGTKVGIDWGYTRRLFLR